MSEEGRTEAMSADPKYVVRTLAELKPKPHFSESESHGLLAYSFTLTHTRWSCSTSTRRCTTST